MNWYQRYIISSNDIQKKLKEIANKIAKGNRKWSLYDLQLQQNYPEELESILREMAKNYD